MIELFFVFVFHCFIAGSEQKNNYPGTVYSVAKILVAAPALDK
jgi:hypothetical protein